MDLIIFHHGGDEFVFAALGHWYFMAMFNFRAGKGEGEARAHVGDVAILQNAVANVEVDG